MILIIDLVILARLVNLLLISQLKIGSLASTLKSFSFEFTCDFLLRLLQFFVVLTSIFDTFEEIDQAHVNILQ